MNEILNPLNVSPSIWLLTLFSAFLVGMSKSGLKGIGMVTIPLMVYLYGARPSVGILLPILIFGDIMALIYYHKSGRFKEILRLFPFAALGIIAAVITGNHINDEQFRDTIAAILLISLVVMLWNELRGKRKSLSDNPLFRGFFGIAGGFATMIGNSAGPIFNLYILSMRLPKNSFIGTGAWFFLTLNLFKVPFHVFSWHTITAHTFHMDLLMIPGIVAGASAGRFVVKLIPEKAYRLFIYTIIFLSSIMLFFK
ncbi:MAG: sulfite exporter TauE/SafE family protein [Chlorobi bacterium]|nr:sulfite exporter TauE/SafE family protein [Chlorobiota bacterium]